MNFFRRKPDIQLEEYKKALFQRDTEIIKLQNQISEKEKEIKRLQEFDKKIEELCKELVERKALSFLSGVASSYISFATFSGHVETNNKKYESLQQLLESQAKQIDYLKERDEDNKKILFLAAKVEQLLTKLKK